MSTTTGTTTLLQPVQIERLPEEGISLSTLTHTAPRSNEDEDLPAGFSRLRQAIVTTQLVGVTCTASIINGLVTVGLPTIIADLQLPSSLSFWPASVSGLATASTLVLAGSIADVVGARPVELVGCTVNGAFMIASGVSRKGEELVVMRAIQGVGVALHLASSVSIITHILPQGRGRNLAFSCLGLGQPLGFSIGLVSGGVLVNTIGWRVGWYICGGLNLLFTVIGWWALPRDRNDQRASDLFHYMKNKIDWVGALLSSAFMALLCYFLAVVSTNIDRIKDAESVVLLCLSVATFFAFITWVHYQARSGKPALIPNTLWKNTSFSSICVLIVLSNAVINSMELFASLFFQEVQQLSALQASIRILPSLVVGALMNLGMGLFIHKVSAIWVVTVTSILCAGSPLLMAVIQPSWPYWANAFVAQLLQPVSCDALFTVGLIVITEIFPEDTQALAGAVFNTAAQFGSALGLAILQIISTLVTKKHAREGEVTALMEGYRASFWTMMAFMMLCTVVGMLGLRKTGRLGLKRD